MKFIVLYIQFINSLEGLGMFFHLKFLSAGFAVMLRQLQSCLAAHQALCMRVLSECKDLNLNKS